MSLLSGMNTMTNERLQRVGSVYTKQGLRDLLFYFYMEPDTLHSLGLW